MRGQVSMEYLLVTAVAFMLVVPLIILFYSQSQDLNEEVTSTQAEKFASEIVDAADQVYYLGRPSKKTLTLYLPRNVKQVYIQGTSLIMEVDSASDDYEIVKWAVANMTGTIGSYEGLHKIEVTARLNDVLIED